MNATSLYVSTCRLVLQADADDSNSWTDLYRLVPYLRQSLSCTVCSNLLIEPHTPTETNCQHHVCRGCRGGRKKLKPSCGWCKDYDKYVENVQLRILLQCYKKLCEYLTSTNIYRTLLLTVTSASNSTTNGAPSTIGATSLMELIQEGAGFKDEFKSNAGLSKSAYSILPCVYTSTTSTQTQGNNIQTTEAISQSIPESPTIRTVSNGSSIYSVMYAGSGNKITIKRKAAATEDTENTGQQETDGNQHGSVGGVKCIPSSHLKYGTPSEKKSSKSSKSSGSFKKPRSSSARSKRKGCRCGNATAIPGKLTCCGQRCPCYVESKPCVECRCRGCRNPHTADGLKIRPHIPELHNLQLQLSTSLDCDALSGDPLGSVPQCLSTSPTTIQVLNVYSTPRLDIDNVPQNLPAALLVGEDAMDVDTVLGIYVGHNLISWSLLNRDCEVLQWSYKSFPRKGPKENIHTLLQETIPIAKKLPKADRYIMQETGGDVGRIQNRHFYQNFVQQSIIGAIILSYLTMLDNKFNDTTVFVANNIFILRQRVLRKIYGLIIDNEGISTQYMVQKLLQESNEPIKTKEPKVLIGTELRNMYNAQSPVCQEQIGWSLLISLAFIELIVHKRPDMILREAPQR